MATLKIAHNRRELTFTELDDDSLTDLVRSLQEAFARDRGVWLTMDSEVRWVPESADVIAEYDGEPPKDLTTLVL